MSSTENENKLTANHIFVNFISDKEKNQEASRMEKAITSKPRLRMTLGFYTQTLRRPKAIEKCHQNLEGKYFLYKIANTAKSSGKHEG